LRQFLLGFGRTISGIGLGVAGACLIIVTAINGANVVARYVFSQPFSWAEEAMVYIMIAGVFWGAAAVAWRQVDIHIDAFVNLASGRLRAALHTFATLISIVILCTLFWMSLRVTSQLYSFGQRNDALDMPVWIAHATFASGLLLIILMTVARLFAPEDPDAQNPGKQAPGKDG
jgi:TRAP-type C4-dicarboxylate transport system permease small subunit